MEVECRRKMSNSKKGFLIVAKHGAHLLLSYDMVGTPGVWGGSGWVGGLITRSSIKWRELMSPCLGLHKHKYCSDPLFPSPCVSIWQRAGSC